MPGHIRYSDEFIFTSPHTCDVNALYSQSEDKMF